MPKRHAKKRTPIRIMAIAQAKAQGIVTGIILAIKGNLHTIGIIGLAILAGYDYWNEHKNSGQIQQVWQHSANWAHKSDITNAVETVIQDNQ